VKFCSELLTSRRLPISMGTLEQIVAKSSARYVSFETNLDLMPGWREWSILLRRRARPRLVCTSLGAFNVPLFFRDARFRTPADSIGEALFPVPLCEGKAHVGSIPGRFVLGLQSGFRSGVSRLPWDHDFCSGRTSPERERVGAPHAEMSGMRADGVADR
jgi:hypothetical protein